MICPKCGYAMDAFDKECPRCHDEAGTEAAPGVDRSGRPGYVIDDTPADEWFEQNTKQWENSQAKAAAASTGSQPQSGTQGRQSRSGAVRYCGKCGASVSADNNYCPNCGETVTPAATAPRRVAPTPDYSSPAPAAAAPVATATNDSSGWFWGCATLIFFFVVLPFSCSLLDSSSSSDSGDVSSVIESPPSDSEIRASLEQQVMEGYNKQLRENDSGLTCSGIHLVKENDRKYTGFADVSNGMKPGVEVILDEDGRMIWSVNPFR